MTTLDLDHQNIITALRDLPEKQRKEVLEKAGIGSPSPDTANRIWQTVVFTFAIIALAAVASLVYGRFSSIVPTPGAIYTSTEMLLTVFTTVSAFLAGLLAPSPVSKN